MPRKIYIVTKNSDGSPDQTPMREWLKQNPERNPTGVDHLAKAFRLKEAFRDKGWLTKKLHKTFLIIGPDESGDFLYANDLFEDHLVEEADEEDEIVEAAEKLTFGLERDLQKALRDNISQLEPGLTIIDGGIERATDAGRIDITAQDSTGNIVVIELKAGRATPEVIAQVLAYMGAVAETDRIPIRGLLVAGDFHDRVVWAARATSNLELKKYSIHFSFESLK